MKKIVSFEELSKIIFKNLKRNVMTNSFLSKQEFESEIKQGNLYYVCVENGLFIFRDRQDFYILNYYIQDININDLNILLKNKIKKPVIVEIVGKNKNDINYLKEVEIFTNVGMKREIERERFVKKNDDIIEIVHKNVNNVENLHVNITLCENQDLQSVMNILNKNFDKYYGCIPTDEAIKQDIINENIYKAVIENDIVGIIHFSKSSKSSEIRHLVVNEKYRNMGIAKLLVKFYDEKIKLKKSVWTGKNNIKAQKVYENTGYIKDNYVSTVMKYVYKI